MNHTEMHNYHMAVTEREVMQPIYTLQSYTPYIFFSKVFLKVLYSNNRQLTGHQWMSID